MPGLITSRVRRVELTQQLRRQVMQVDESIELYQLDLRWALRQEHENLARMFQENLHRLLEFRLKLLVQLDELLITDMNARLHL